MDRNFHLTDHDRHRLNRIAKLIDAEAQSWRDGWCVFTDHGPVWTDTSEHGRAFHARCVKLENASKYLRNLIREHELGPSPRVEAAIAAE